MVRRRKAGFGANLYSYYQPPHQALTFSMFWHPTEVTRCHEQNQFLRLLSVKFNRYTKIGHLRSTVPQRYNYLPSIQNSRISQTARFWSFINSTSPSTKCSFIASSPPNSPNDIIQSKHVADAANCLDRTHLRHSARRGCGTPKRRDEEAVCARTCLKSLPSGYNADQEMG